MFTDVPQMYDHPRCAVAVPAGDAASNRSDAAKLHFVWSAGTSLSPQLLKLYRHVMATTVARTFPTLPLVTIRSPSHRWMMWLLLLRSREALTIADCAALFCFFGSHFGSSRTRSSSLMHASLSILRESTPVQCAAT